MRPAKLYTFGETTDTVAGWASRVGITADALYARLRKYPMEVSFDSEMRRQQGLISEVDGLRHIVNEACSRGRIYANLSADEQRRLEAIRSRRQH